MMMNNGEEDELYEQLWKACAGPHVEVPRAGQRVFYFPQGHMEQVCFCFCSFCWVLGCLKMCCLKMLGIWIYAWFYFLFWLRNLFFFCSYFISFCGYVVRSINKSGTKSEDSIVQTSQQDPLSCCQCSFTGNFLLHPIFFSLLEKTIRRILWFLYKFKGSNVHLGFVVLC